MNPISHHGIISVLPDGQRGESTVPPAGSRAEYFEEFIANNGDAYPKTLGVRRVAENTDNRKLGSEGRREIILTEPIELIKGVNSVCYKFSPKKPQRVWTMLQKLEGK
jgi:hypothetical protein